MIDLKHFFNVTFERPRNGKVERKFMGSFYNDGRTVAVLQDHHGMLEGLPQEGLLTPDVAQALERLHGASYVRVRPRFPEEAKPKKPQEASVGEPQTELVRPPPVFDYHRVGMDKPHVLEVRDGHVALDGSHLTGEEVATVLDNVKTNAATLRYRQPGTPPPDMAKAEELFLALAKAEGGTPSKLSDSLEAMRQLVQQGHLPQEHYDRVRQALFGDDMTGLGNKRAYGEHHERGLKPGVTAMLDLNGLKGANDALGHEAGDAMIGAAGRAIRAAIDKTVGPENAKAWRLGGDEFSFHVPTHEHAGRVLRQLRHELEAIPPVGGTHKVSLSVGLGVTPQTADQALYRAKDQKKEAIRALGGDPESRVAGAPHHMYVHSLVPGVEGPSRQEDYPPLASVPPSPVSPAPVAGGAASEPVVRK